MNKSILAAAGFNKELVRIEAGKCPICGFEVDKFRDALSEREYHISGMCQAC
jgi:hypothetical protein